jgi:hypothetical protein
MKETSRFLFFSLLLLPPHARRLYSAPLSLPLSLVVHLIKEQFSPSNAERINQSAPSSLIFYSPPNFFSRLLLSKFHEQSDFSLSFSTDLFFVFGSSAVCRRSRSMLLPINAQRAG